MNPETKDMPGTLEEIEGVATAARDAMTEDIIGRVAGTAAEALDLVDQVNRSGLARAIPLLAQMVDNGDLQRVVSLGRIYGSAEDALTEEMVGRIADAAGGGLSLLDQVHRSGLEKALPTLTRLVADGDIERLAQLARVYGAAQDAMSEEIVGRLAEAASEGLSLLDRLGARLECLETAAKQAETERTEGGVVSMWRMLTDARTQETMRFMLALG